MAIAVCDIAVRSSIGSIDVDLAECCIGLFQVSFAKTPERTAAGSARAAHDGSRAGPDFHYEWAGRLTSLLVKGYST